MTAAKAFAVARKKILAAVEAGIGDSAHAIRDDAKKNVPQDSGELHDNIVATVNGPTARVGVFDDDTYYGSYVEFGTSKQRAQPFLGPAAERERGQIARRIVRRVEEAL